MAQKLSNREEHQESELAFDASCKTQCDQPFQGIVVCVTGLLPGERRFAEQATQKLGGQYSAELTPFCTHLVAQISSPRLFERSEQYINHKTTGLKYQHAVKHGLKKGLRIVTLAWLVGCSKLRCRLDECNYSIELALRVSLGGSSLPVSPPGPAAPSSQLAASEGEERPGPRPRPEPGPGRASPAAAALVLPKVPGHVGGRGGPPVPALLLHQGEGNAARQASSSLPEDVGQAEAGKGPNMLPSPTQPSQSMGCVHTAINSPEQDQERDQHQHQDQDQPVVESSPGGSPGAEQRRQQCNDSHPELGAGKGLLKTWCFYIDPRLDGKLARDVSCLRLPPNGASSHIQAPTVLSC
eukprot:jgi/Mesen1/9510/ME000637S08956